MLDAGSAAQIAEIYELGDDPLLTGPVARGEVGQVWRMTTSHGAFAVKEPFEQLSVAEADDDAAYQDAVSADVVLMPPGRNPSIPGTPTRSVSTGGTSRSRTTCYALLRARCG